MGSGHSGCALLDRNWNESGHFQPSLDQAHRAAGLALTWPPAPAPPLHSSERGFDFFFFTMAPTPSKNHP